MENRTVIGRKFKFEAAHRLWSSVPKTHGCHRIHGHSYHGEVIITANTLFSDRDMLIEFSTLKKIIQDTIENGFDHQLILNMVDPLGTILAREKQPYVIMEGDPTVENMSKTCAFLIFRQILKDTSGEWCHSVTVKMHETENCYASFTLTKERLLSEDSSC